MSAAESTGIIGLMMLPFLECLVLVGIHSYLGLHVIRRRVIFVDLALAQVAALGTTVAFLFGLNPHSHGAYIFSLIFTFIAAGVFALTRLRRDHIPQEAIIGLSYALAASLGILVVFGAPHGAEHIQEIAMGSLLWVRPEQVIHAAVVYLIVGIIHVIFRRQFRLISDDPEAAYRSGMNVRGWDFLFYLLFGLVITHSVQTAGVLLVFVFLVVPAIVGVLLTNRMGLQLLVGWAVGTAVSIGGLAASYYQDLPSGPTVVAAYGIALVLIALTVYVVRASNRPKALTFIGIGVLVLGLITGGLWGLGNWFSSLPAMSMSPQELAEHPQGHTPQEITPQSEVHLLLKELQQRDLLDKQDYLQSHENAPLLQEAFAQCSDQEGRLVLAQRILPLTRTKGALLLMTLLETANCPPILREEALGSLQQAFATKDLGYDPFSSPQSSKNQLAIQKWRTLIES